MSPLADNPRSEEEISEDALSRAPMAAAFGRRGIAFAPSQANFLLVRVADARRARERLLAGGILVRDGAAVGFPGHLRITVGTREINERLLKLLEE